MYVRLSKKPIFILNVKPMKTRLLALSLFALSLCVLSSKTFAQTTTIRGGGGSGSGLPAAAVSFSVPVGTDIVLNFDQASTAATPVLTSVSYKGVVSVINGNLAQLTCLNFYQFFQVIMTYASYQHPSGCQQTQCVNPRCHQ